MSTKQKLEKEAKKPPFFISYLITDPLLYGNTPKQFEQNFTNALLKQNIAMVCFRDKQTKDTSSLIKSFKTIAQQYQIDKIIINSDIEKAIDMKLDGVHLTSQQFDKITYAKQHNLYTIISCHNEQEVSTAKQYGADAITYSPIFYKENKGDPKGCKNLQMIVEKYQEGNFRIIALGGIINHTQIEQIKDTNCAGFASIRYFTN